MFGYDPGHSGSALSPVTAATYRPLRARALPYTANAAFSMPLYGNGWRDSLP